MRTPRARWSAGVDAERLAILRAGPDGAEWQDVRIFAALMSDGSAITFASKSAPVMPKAFERDGDGNIIPVMWSTRVPLYCAIRLDAVQAITEIEIVPVKDGA